jgi:photosystem II PsbU protein
MKRLAAWLMGGLVLFGLLFALVLPPAAYAADRRNIADDKIAERAGKIVLGGPYNSVDDVLKLDLTERQKELFDKYKDNFTVTAPEVALNEGFDRINDGQYR